MTLQQGLANMLLTEARTHPPVNPGQIQIHETLPPYYRTSLRAAGVGACLADHCGMVAVHNGPVVHHPRARDRCSGSRAGVLGMAVVSQILILELSA